MCQCFLSYFFNTFIFLKTFASSLSLTFQRDGELQAIQSFLMFAFFHFWSHLCKCLLYFLVWFSKFSKTLPRTSPGSVVFLSSCLTSPLTFLFYSRNQFEFSPVIFLPLVIDIFCAFIRHSAALIMPTPESISHAAELFHSSGKCQLKFCVWVPEAEFEPQSSDSKLNHSWHYKGVLQKLFASHLAILNLICIASSAKTVCAILVCCNLQHNKLSSVLFSHIVPKNMTIHDYGSTESLFPGDG